VTALDAVREWVGSNPDDTTVNGFLARHDDNPDRAALAILRRRRADLAVAPASWRIDGDASETQGKADTLAALDDQIGRLERLCGVDTGGATVTSAPICPTESIVR
jgi:hypothetical protein